MLGGGYDDEYPIGGPMCGTESSMGESELECDWVYECWFELVCDCECDCERDGPAEYGPLI